MKKQISFEQNFLYSNIYERLHSKKKNFILVVVGPTGSGKSYSALRFCEQIDPSFNASRIVFYGDDFLDILEQMKIGQFIIWDEAGVGIPARDWHSIINKTISYILQTYRKKRFGIIFTVPSFDFIDVHARKLVHALGKCSDNSINYEKKECGLQFYWLQYNPFVGPKGEGKIYKHYPRIKMNGEVHVIKKLKFPLPSKKLRDDYEDKKDIFLDRLLKSAHGDIKGVYKKKVPPQEDMIKQIIDDIKEYIDPETNKLSPPMIQYKFGCGRTKAYNMARIVKTLLIKTEKT